jgi:hypothetical protein
VLAVPCLPAVTAPATSAAFSTTSPRLVWGLYAKPRGSENLQTALEHTESKLGRKVGATRRYLSWDGSIGSYDRWLVSSGRLPLISVKSVRHNGTKVAWGSIADAKPGSALYSQMQKWADGVKSLKKPVYFTFNHEPEAAASNSFGTSAQYVSAWRKIVSVFRARGVTNAKFLWIMTGWSFDVGSGDRRQAAKWYPGDGYVDALGSDEYNAYTCRSDRKLTWQPLGQQVESFRLFGLEHPGKELWLPEFGSVEDTQQPGRKATWLREARSLFENPKYAQFKGLVYFNGTRPGTPCQWWLDSSSSAFSAYAAMGKDTFFSATR